MSKYVMMVQKIFGWLRREDAKALARALLMNSKQWKTKWDVIRFVYSFIRERYGESLALRAARVFALAFDELFERGQFFEFYHLSEVGLEIISKYIEPQTKTPQHAPKRNEQLSLSPFLSKEVKAKGVRA